MRRAVIWDMDGVVVDTAAWHFSAWRELCKRHGRGLEEEEFRRTFGQRNPEIIAQWFGERDERRVRELAEEKEELFRAEVDHSIEPLPGVTGLLAALQDAGFVQAIGSSAPRENVELLLKSLGVRHFYQAIVAEEDVQAGKPDPEIFQKAAERLGASPNDCLVIEDAVAGVTAAKAAGMSCIAVTNTRGRKALAEADLVVDTLADVDVATIADLISAQRADEAR